MPDIHVAWWNLENLFDHENAQREPELKRALQNELEGWTETVRDRKLDQLALIIKQMFKGAGPDLLGVCEVENERVLEMLTGWLKLSGRKYRVLGHDSPDARGIDVSFIYDANALTMSDPGHQVVIRRTGTRDLFWATVKVKKSGEKFVALANHWPARSQGQYESEPYRMLTGETASYVLSGFVDPRKGGPDLPVLLMGDFNDEPFNRSMQEYLLGARDAEQVIKAKTPRVLNLMWPLLAGDPPGTYRFGSTWNMLDQFLVTKGLLHRDSRVQVIRDSVAIFRTEDLKGKGGAPRHFGRPAKPSSYDRDGFSDHYPITVELCTK